MTAMVIAPKGGVDALTCGLSSSPWTAHVSILIGFCFGKLVDLCGGHCHLTWKTSTRTKVEQGDDTTAVVMSYGNGAVALVRPNKKPTRSLSVAARVLPSRTGRVWDWLIACQAFHHNPV